MESIVLQGMREWLKEWQKRFHNIALSLKGRTPLADEHMDVRSGSPKPITTHYEIAASQPREMETVLPGATCQASGVNAPGYDFSVGIKAGRGKLIRVGNLYVAFAIPRRLNSGIDRRSYEGDRERK